jgi:pyruvate formate lyase activating enzyme
MKIGGLQQFTTIDYPGKMAAIVFTQGCNFRCPYCHNSELVIPRAFQEAIPEGTVLEFLHERKKFLEGVVISGGEPTIHKDLILFLEKIKKLGYSIKLDTNGSSPEVLRNAIDAGLVDFLAMDVKGPWSKYATLAGRKINLQNIKESIRIIQESGLPHIFRTTCVKKYLKRSDFMEIWRTLNNSPNYIMQPFVATPKVLNKDLLQEEQYLDEEIRSFYLDFGLKLGVFK